MIEMIIRKKLLKDALAVAKRAISKEDKIRLIGQENILFVHTIADNMEIYEYIPLLSLSSSFAVEIDPLALDKWLDKSDRDMIFQINDDKFTCVEKKEATNIIHLEKDKNWFFDARTVNYDLFEQPEVFLKALEETNLTFFPYERKYAEYAKITNNNLFVYNPLITSIFFLRETLGIEKLGQNGFAIHKSSVDVIVKSIKNPKKFSHGMTNKNFLLRENDTIFSIPLKTDISFPDIRTDLQALPDGKSQITINTNEVLNAINTFDSKEVTKIMFDADNNNRLVISCDSIFHEPITLANKYYAPRSVFSAAVIKAFLEGLTGDINIGYTLFNSNSNKEAYLWKFQDKQKSKIIPGIKEAPGFKQKQEPIL